MKPPFSRPFVVALGSNLGPREEHIAAAFSALSTLPATRLLARSPVTETAPVGGPPQGPYLNAAALIESAIAPLDLLDHLLAIERRAGRERRERWGPRTLDLDLLWSPGLILDEPRLQLPHPRLAERIFALEPLLALAPEARDPRTGEPYAAALARLRAASPA